MAHIVICGGGYAGIQTALELDRLLAGSRHAVTLIDKSEHHALLPSLPEAILRRGFYRIPYMDIFAKRKRIKFFQSAIKTINLDKKQVVTAAGTVNYDILVIALGGRLGRGQRLRHCGGDASGGGGGRLRFAV